MTLKTFSSASGCKVQYSMDRCVWERFTYKNDSFIDQCSTCCKMYYCLHILMSAQRKTTNPWSMKCPFQNSHDLFCTRQQMKAMTAITTPRQQCGHCILAEIIFVSNFHFKDFKDYVQESVAIMLLCYYLRSMELTHGILLIVAPGHKSFKSSKCSEDKPSRKKMEWNYSVMTEANKIDMLLM